MVEANQSHRERQKAARAAGSTLAREAVTAGTKFSATLG
jgi:hypothetical protein